MTAVDEAVQAMHEASVELARLRARVEKLENTLAVIAAHENKTLLGGGIEELLEIAPYRDPTTELAYEIGAHRAFGECGRMAREALA